MARRPTPRGRRLSDERTVLVVNAAARRGADLFEEAREALARCRVPLAAAHATEDPGELRRLVRAEVRRGARRVLVGGGDGTLSAAAGILAGTGVALGVVPLGTANDFARSLRIPADLSRACRVVARGHVRDVDVAFAGRRAFLNAASVGASSAAARSVSPGLKRAAGALAYPVAGAAAVAAPPFRVRLELDRAVHQGWALQVVIGNGRYHGGGRLVTPRARPDDGALDVYVLAAADPDARGAGRLRNAATLAAYALLLVRGRHLEHGRVVHARAARVTLRTEPPLELDVDGELAGRTPATFHVERGALRVLAPAPRPPRP